MLWQLKTTTMSKKKLKPGKRKVTSVGNAVTRDHSDPLVHVLYTATYDRLTAEVELDGFARLVGHAKYREKEQGKILWGEIDLPNDRLPMKKGVSELFFAKAPGESVTLQNGRRFILTVNLDNPNTQPEYCHAEVRIYGWKGLTKTPLAPTPDVLYDGDLPADTGTEEYVIYQLEVQ